MTAQKTSREIILGLNQRGFSDRQIGALIGRNDRLIGQVRSGAKPGANLRNSLASVSSRTARVKDTSAYVKRTGAIAEPARRVTAQGTPAQVRKGGDVVKGRTIAKQFHQKIAKAAREDRIVSLKVRYSDIEEYGDDDSPNDEPVEASYAERGISARTFLSKLDEYGYKTDPQGAFEEVLRQNPHLESVSGFRGYSLTISDRKGKR